MYSKYFEKAPSIEKNKVSVDIIYAIGNNDALNKHQIYARYFSNANTF